MRHAPLAAAIILTFTFFLHIFGGGPEFDQPFQAQLGDEKLKAVAAILWHFISAALAIAAIAGLALWRRPNRDLALTVAALVASLGILFIFYSLTRLGSLWALPQWTIFAVAAPLLVARSPRPQMNVPMA